MTEHPPHVDLGRTDAPLWAAALVLSILLNAGFVLVLNSQIVRERLFSRDVSESISPPPDPRVLQMVFTTPEAETREEEARPKRFTRTTEEQRAEAPEEADFIGERDTRAAAEQTPDAGAPDLPSQVGIEPRDELDIETTESDFRDGPLDAPDVDAIVPDVPAEQRIPGVEVDQPGDSDILEPVETAPAPMTERLLEGPLPTDVPVPIEPEVKEGDSKEAAVEAPPKGNAEEEVQKPDPVVDPTRQLPGFRGHQRRTAIRGSISRTGPSSLDVQDNALGRYQARISRAVELEWQRNCVRHRDFIRPGFLTVRFFVEPTGRVRTVEFVGQMETGEVQKGFTLNSIRNAQIPPMPKEIRKELEDEPLELIFNFYF